MEIKIVIDTPLEELDEKEKAYLDNVICAAIGCEHCPIVNTCGNYSVDERIAYFGQKGIIMFQQGSTTLEPSETELRTLVAPGKPNVVLKITHEQYVFFKWLAHRGYFNGGVDLKLLETIYPSDGD